MVIDSDAPYWFALLTDKHVPRTTAKMLIYRCCLEEGSPLALLLDMQLGEMAERYEMPVDMARRVLSALQTAPAASARLDQLDEQDVHLMLRADVAYPEALAERLAERWLPYYFFYRGDLELLTEPGVCILGGRQARREAMALAAGLGRSLAERKVPLLGGYDQGVDRAALDAAREVGGRLTIMLPLGLVPFAGVARSMQAEIAEGRLLLLSPFEPEAAHSPALAEARQVPLVALAEALVLIAPETAPEDWATLPPFLLAERRIFIWSGTDAEVARAWVERGAIPFDDARGLHRRLNELFGQAAADPMEPDTAPVEADAELAIDALPDVEPIAFTDAESAIETLGRTGRVPDILAGRLRDMEWPNDLDYLVRYDDLEPDLDDEGASSSDRDVDDG
jgi:predicted Rossmann fold nucleotide-binding protein DprA/Smf involved in DNA uptake